MPDANSRLIAVSIHYTKENVFVLGHYFAFIISYMNILDTIYIIYLKKLNLRNIYYISIITLIYCVLPDV